MVLFYCRVVRTARPQKPKRQAATDLAAGRVSVSAEGRENEQEEEEEVEGGEEEEEVVKGEEEQHSHVHSQRPRKITRYGGIKFHHIVYTSACHIHR